MEVNVRYHIFPLFLVYDVIMMSFIIVKLSNLRIL